MLAIVEPAIGAPVPAPERAAEACEVDEAIERTGGVRLVAGARGRRDEAEEDRQRQVGLRRPMAAVRHRNMLVAFAGAPVLVDLRHGQQRGRPLVDVALKLNVLAVFAAFVFVSAILLGAF